MTVISATTEIIERSLTALGLSYDTQTNPELIKQILVETRLDDFTTSDPKMSDWLRASTTLPQPLGTIFKNIKTGILTKHPAVEEFLQLAIQNNWFGPSPIVTRAIHFLYILEFFTAAMCNNHNFFLEVQQHFKKKEKDIGLDTLHMFRTLMSALKISPHFFDIAKPMAVDPLLIYFKFQRDLSAFPITKAELKKLYRDKQINYLEYRLLAPAAHNHIGHLAELIRINIYEAGLIEYKNGFHGNALCAQALCDDLKNNPPQIKFNKRLTASDQLAHPTLKITTSQLCTSLYTTWNMAFVLGNLNDLDIALPKLLTPSLLNANGEEFLSVRFVSLWLAINFAIFRKYDKRKILGPANKVEMAKSWEQINKKYALILSQKEVQEDAKTLKKYYHRFFSHPCWNWFKLVRNFD